MYVQFFHVLELVVEVEVPFIYEDRISEEQFIGALDTFTSIPKEQRNIIGQLGRQHVIDNFNFTNCS